MCLVTCVTENYYHHEKIEKCVACHESCLRCKGSNTTDCVPNACVAFYEWNEKYNLCTQVCSKNKYYEPAKEKCESCPLLEQCSLCGPSRNQCLNEESCNEGFEWDLENPNSCKIKLTLAALEDMGLNPNKQYFQMDTSEEESAVEETAAVVGDQNAYKEGDYLELEEEKTLIFETAVKISFQSDACQLSYTDPLTSNEVPFEKSIDEEMTLPEQVENIFQPGCTIQFLQEVATIERAKEEGIQEETVSTEPVQYEKDDVVEFLNEQTEVRYKYDTKVEYKYTKSLLDGIETTFTPEQQTTYDKNSSIRFYDEPKNGDIETNLLEFIKKGDEEIKVNVIKSKKVESLGNTAEKTFEEGSAIKLENDVEMKFEEDTKIKVDKQVGIEPNSKIEMKSGQKITFQKETVVSSKKEVTDIEEESLVQIQANSDVTFLSDAQFRIESDDADIELLVGNKDVMKFKSNPANQEIVNYLTDSKIRCKINLDMTLLSKITLDIEITETITYKAGEAVTIIDDAEITIQDGGSQEIKVEEEIVFKAGETVEFSPSQTLTFKEPGKKVEMVSNTKIVLEVKKPPPPPPKTEEDVETAIEDPTVPAKPTVGTVEKYKKGTSIEFTETTEVSYPSGAVFMDEHRETIIIEPGQTVIYEPKTTFILLSKAEAIYKTASEIITQEDVIQNEVSSKDNKVGDRIKYRKGVSIEIRQDVKFKILENDVRVIANGEEV